jgi:hypothetical protein
MNLQSLLNTLLKKKGSIPPARVRPLRSSLKRYAALLGYPDLASCPEAAFNLSQRKRNHLIETLAQPVNRRNGGGDSGFSARTLANIKYDVGVTLKQGASLGLIKAQFGPEGLEPTTGTVIFKYMSHQQFHRGETNCLPPVAISEKDLPLRLRRELDAYWEWATAEFVLNRPRTRKRRAISANYDRELLRRVAGFHVKHCGAAVKTLSLRSLVNEEYAAKYVNWFISHHGRATFTLQNVLISLVSLANYLAIIAKDSKSRKDMTDASRRLKDIKDRLPDCVAVRDKKKFWLSLEQIETCGINRYPRNPARLEASSEAVRRKLQTLNLKGCGGSNLELTAVYALESLLVRLMIRIPLRLRNFCEMSWNPTHPEEGKNLFRKDGSWYIQFSGPELKVGMRRGKINSVLHRVPSELTWLVEEVLTVWRPIITGIPYRLPDEGKCGPKSYQEPSQTKASTSKKDTGNVLLFLTRDCKPANRDTIRFWVESTTYAYTGIAVYPHLIRDIWATTYIKETGDIPGAAKRLGNTVEITLKHYAHLLDEEAEEKGDAFNRKLFGLDSEQDE